MSNPMTRRRLIQSIFALGLCALATLALATWLHLAPLPASLDPDPAGLRKAQVRDRSGRPLTVTYRNAWNYHDRVPLHAVPPLLVEALVLSEDQRFFAHGGVDWRGRLHALWQNLAAGRVVRGASTLSEQVVRMLHPRPRTLWARWLEGFDAQRLEARFAKSEILSFYLDQVPYAAQRRGVAQGARQAFGRDLATLSEAEMLALAVMVRAPAQLDPRRNAAGLKRRVLQLGERLVAAGALDAGRLAAIGEDPLAPGGQDLAVSAEHFVAWLAERGVPAGSSPGVLATTLDGSLQAQAEALLATRLADLAGRRVAAGAVLVADHQRGEILAWVNGRADAERSGDAAIDAVRTPRQPGSTLKPFVYALALEQGWTPATLLDDAPLASPVGSGQHPFRNYSRRHYGPLRLRDCLGNSLNIPAVLAARQVGPARLLALLREAGFASLTREAEIYGLGLALGNGEVSLHELVTGYAALARGGLARPLTALQQEELPPARRLFSAESATLIADILADPTARELEFGRGGILALPHPAAVKTGTSTDYRDAWAVGFDHRFVVGVWLGNLDRTPMENVTGATGPALVLRSLFAELARTVEPQPLPLSPALRGAVICRTSGALARPGCPTRPEWFVPELVPALCPLAHGEAAAAAAVVIADRDRALRLRQPSDGLLLARDPRLPDALERYPFELPAGVEPQRTEWLVDGVVVAVTGPGVTRWLWPLASGSHTAAARIWTDAAEEGRVTEASRFTVRGR